MARDYKAEASYMKKVFRKIPKLPKDIDQWVRNNPLSFSKYLFCFREKGIRYGYCTHCGKTSQLDGPMRSQTYDERMNGAHKHNECGTCPACHSPVQFKDAGRGRGKMYDYAKFLIILKKDNGIFLRFFDVLRDYRYDYKNVETDYTEEYRAFFCEGKTTMWKQGYESDYWSVERGENPRVYFDEWAQMSKVTDGYRECMIYKHDRLYEDVFKDTPFQYSMYQEYDQRMKKDYHFAPVHYLEKCCKYSAIEQLTKIGFTNLVDDYVNDRGDSTKVYWRGKTPQKVLGLTKSEIKALSKINPDLAKINIYKFFNKKVEGLTDCEKQKFMNGYEFYQIKDLPSKIPSQANLRKVFRYIEKQVKGEKDPYRANVIHDWLDYIGNCKKLEYDLNDETILYPRKLKAAHDKAYRLVKVNGNKAADNKIRSMYLEKLKRYGYREKEFFITVASCAADLIQEGQKMHHCVGTYIDRVAENQCTILFIRRTAEPDKPLATCEVRGNEPIQIRAHNDDVPEGDVMAFWERFKAKKLNKQPKKAENRKAG